MLRQVLNLCNPLLNKGLEFCSACQYGKSHVLPFSISETKTTSPLEVIHSDIWGSTPSPGSTGYRYYIHFINDYTCFTWIYALKHKFEAIVAFKQFKLFVEKTLNKSILCVQTNWGGEFCPFVVFLSQNGIQFCHPCPHIHQQNGLVERKHHHIVEIGLTLLAQADMPLFFW